MAPQTRAERREQYAARLAAQKARKESLEIAAQHRQQRQAARRKRIIFLTVIATIVVSFIAASAYVLITKTNTVELVKANYQVEAAQVTSYLDYASSDVTITLDGNPHICRGLTNDILQGKTPLTCSDGAVVRPKP